MKNKFVKFPLVLGLVGLICGLALSIVYGITNPIIKQRQNAAAIEAIKAILPETENAIDITADQDTDAMSTYGINTVYQVEKSNETFAYGYQVKATGYGGEMVFLVALSSTEETVLGFKTISHNETNSGSYGGPLLNSEEFNTQFAGMAFDKVDTDLEFKAGSTAKVTMAGVKKAVDNAITFHKTQILGQEASSIQLTDAEIAKLNLASGTEIVDVTETFTAKLGNKKDQAVTAMGLLNALDFTLNGTVTGHAYVSTKHIKIPEVGEQDIKLVFMFDANWANSKLIVVNTSDTLTATENTNYHNGEDYDPNATSIADHTWINQFQGRSMASMNAELEESLNIDTMAGATFTTASIKNTLVAIVKWHNQAYK